jgi:topoisomerase-4 subunit A
MVFTRIGFLDYASYVILERAVPRIEDGFKPVQRRIMHALKEMDDGRFNKVANVIGSTMQYHPHGDASIGEAIVNIGQKDILIETQGNWGDVRTGTVLRHHDILKHAFQSLHSK